MARDSDEIEMLSRSDDDSDPAVSDVASQFTCANSNEKHTVPVGQSPNRFVMHGEQFLVHVALPRVESEEAYEFLPGHSQVHQILRRDSSLTSYMVELKSGDIELVRLFLPFQLRF
jgi:hypothetical protein